jgi:hypothetical protein
MPFARRSCGPAPFVYYTPRLVDRPREFARESSNCYAPHIAIMVSLVPILRNLIRQKIRTPERSKSMTAVMSQSSQRVRYWSAVGMVRAKASGVFGLRRLHSKGLARPVFLLPDDGRWKFFGLTYRRNRLAGLWLRCADRRARAGIGGLFRFKRFFR